jgi:hypothetical protein
MRTCSFLIRLGSAAAEPAPKHVAHPQDEIAVPEKRIKADVAATKAPAGPKKRSANTVKVNNDQVADSRVHNYHTYTYHVLDMVCVDTVCVDMVCVNTVYVDTVYVSVVIMYMPFKVQSPPDSFGAALRPIYQMGRMCCISELPVSRHM